MLLFTLAFGGCSNGRGVVQGSSDSPAPAASSGQPLSACGSLTTHPGYTQQYLYAGNLWGAPVLTVFKIDASTGALSEMPWSPISTFNGMLSATMDPSDKYLYVSSRAPFGLNHQPITTLETFTIPSDDSQPINRGHIQSGSSDLRLAFDPQGKFFYELPRSNDGQLIPWAVGVDGVPVSAGALIPLSLGWPTTYAFKASGNLVLVGHGTAYEQPLHSQDGVAVYREDCATGTLSLVKNNIFPVANFSAFSRDPIGPNFISASTTGDLVVGWYCGVPLPQSNYQYHVDAQTGVLTVIPDSQILGLCETSFDSSGQYAIGRMEHDSGSDSIAVFRVDSVRGLVETDRYTLPLFEGASQRILSSPIFDLSGTFVYANATEYVIALRLDRSTGKLTLVSDYPQARENSFSPLFIVAR
ncbi:MAG: hypothetical protein DMG62_24480 [Acidobacteria bacterium]|nr:MAG: hypothetical protein DMG62_24480 [Acidobacteriota bacterium]